MDEDDSVKMEAWRYSCHLEEGSKISEKELPFEDIQ